MERKSETTRNFTRVNNLTLLSLSRSLMKHVLSNSHSEKLPEKSRPRSIPSLIKRDTLRRKRFDKVSDLIFVWPLDGDQVFCIDSKTNKHKKQQQQKWKFSAGHSNRWHFLSTVSRSNWNVSFFIKRSKHRFLDPD